MRLDVAGTRLRHRRGLTALLAVLGMVTTVLAVLAPAPPTARADEPVCTVSAKLVNSCRPWLGAESGGYGVTGLRARMQEHETRIGRQLDIVHAYLGPSTALPADVVTLAKRPGTIAYVNWKPAYRWAQAAGGTPTVDAQIDALAASIKALGQVRIMLTVYHEPENDISPGGTSACPSTLLGGSAGTAADYVAMWHNVRARFDAAGVTNVVWAMNYTGWYEWECAVKALWPGNDLVDWVVWDPYTRNATWTATVGRFYRWLETNSDSGHDFLSKPWGLGEFGYVGTSQTAAYAMYDEARRNLQNGVHPRLKAYVVWDNRTASSNDDRVGFDGKGVRDPVEQQRYNAFANDPLLSGAWTREAADLSAPTVGLSDPVGPATVEDVVEVTGSASDDVAVESVALLVDGRRVWSSEPDGDGRVATTWDTNTVPNGEHSLQLKVRDPTGNVGLSERVLLAVENVDEEAPTTPGEVSAAWSRPRTVVVGWSAASDDRGVTGYRVHRDGVPVATLGPDARSFSDNGLEEVTAYSYRVTALDAVGNESEPSAESAVTTGDETAPSAPVVEAERVDGDGARLTWSESMDNVAVAGYRVYRNDALVSTVDAGTRSLAHSGLAQGVDHAYRVAAFDAADNRSELSEAATVTIPDVVAPGAPTELKAVSGSTSVTLTWKPAGDNVGVESYVVHRDGLPFAVRPGTATTFTDSALIGTTAHEYHVTAADKAGNVGPASSTVTRSLSDTTAPSTPTGLARTLSGFTVRLTWRPSTDNVGVKDYTVYRGGVAVATTTATAYTDPTPPTGRTSSYTVRARDAAGNLSAASSAVSASVPADRTAPSRPTGLTATAGTRQITLSWAASSDNVGVTSYYLYRANAKYRLLGKVLSFTDTGLVAGRKYTYKLYALDAAGNWSGASVNVSATAR